MAKESRTASVRDTLPVPDRPPLRFQVVADAAL